MFVFPHLLLHFKTHQGRHVDPQIILGVYFGKPSQGWMWRYCANIVKVCDVVYYDIVYYYYVYPTLVIVHLRRHRSTVYKRRILITVRTQWPRGEREKQLCSINSSRTDVLESAKEFSPNQYNGNNSNSKTCIGPTYVYGNTRTTKSGNRGKKREPRAHTGQKNGLRKQ